MTATSLRSAVQLLTGAIEAGAEQLKFSRSILEQLGSFSDAELGQFGQRIPHIRAVLRQHVPPVEELISFLAPPFTGLPKPEKIEPLKGNWIEQLLRAEKGAWEKLGVEISPALQSLFMEVLKERGKERVELDRAYDLAHCLLPDLVLTSDWYKEYKLTAPKQWYWEQLKSGRLLWPNGAKIKESRLQAGIYLVDTRCKPQFADGKQRWAHDEQFMEFIIGTAQDRGLPISETGGRGSRFYCSRLDYEQVIAPLYAQALELPEGSIIRLEMVPEWSLFCQYKSGDNWPRAKDGQTNTWCWFHEFFRSSDDSLLGGDSVYGGLALVRYDDSDSCRDLNSAHLLAVLATTR